MVRSYSFCYVIFSYFVFQIANVEIWGARDIISFFFLAILDEGRLAFIETIARTANYYFFH